MTELAHLKTMWRPKIRRSLNTIIDISAAEIDGEISNPHWEYSLSYAFKEALDISYDERVKDKKKYMVWTQGPILRFKEGDVIKSKDGKGSVQVIEAKPMAWDKIKGEMNEGLILYNSYEIKDGIATKSGVHTVTQMDFLFLLIGFGIEWI